MIIEFFRVFPEELRCIEQGVMQIDVTLDEKQAAAYTGDLTARELAASLCRNIARDMGGFIDG